MVHAGCPPDKQALASFLSATDRTFSYRVSHHVPLVWFRLLTLGSIFRGYVPSDPDQLENTAYSAAALQEWVRVAPR